MRRRNLKRKRPLNISSRQSSKRQSSRKQKVDNRINNAINRNTEKIIDVMLNNKNIQKQMPEIEAGLTHFVVYMPKWLKHLKETKGSGEKK